MAGQMIIAGLDIGSHDIKCVIGVHHEDGQVDVIGTGTHPANGFQRGIVSNSEAAVRSIKSAVGEASLMADVEIKEVLLSVSSRHFNSHNDHGMARILGTTVDSDDVHAVVDVASAIKLPNEHQIMHVVPQDFIVDGRRGIANPLGVRGVRMEVQAHVVAGHLARIESIEACCRQARLSVVDAIYSPLAQSEALLTQRERDVGVILLDLGADTTDISVFEGGSIIHAAMLPIGGERITQDIKDLLGTPTVEAEHLKRVHGCATTGFVKKDESVSIPGVGGRKPREIDRYSFCEIIEARAAEILQFVADELDQIGCSEGFPGGVVLTGAGANLEGMVELTQDILGLHTTKGQPNGLHGLVDVIRDPRYSTATGLVSCGVQLKHLQWFSSRQVRLKRRGAKRSLRFWSRG